MCGDKTNQVFFISKILFSTHMLIIYKKMSKKLNLHSKINKNIDNCDINVN